MSKIGRKYMAHLIDVTFGGNTASWERLGADLEEYNVDLNPDIETGKNILEEATFNHSGYEESSDADPYYADTDSKLFVKLQDIIDTRATGDACKTKALEVHLWDGDEATGFVAYQQDCYVVPTSYGGDTSGYQIPFSVYYVGARTKGTYNTSTKKFTAAA